MTTVAPALELSNISKSFGTTAALREASLILRPKTIHALLGENGAGKTTLLRIAFGLAQPDEGRITVDGTPVHFSSPRDAIAAGLGMVHQHFMLVPAMSVSENIALGGRGRYSRSAIRERVTNASHRYGLPINPDALVRDLSVGAQQRVEILKALTHNATILILDEPTAVLTESESFALLTKLREFVDAGGSVVLITHKLRDALAFADDVTVLRHGKVTLTAPTQATDESALAKAMIGTDWRKEQEPASPTRAVMPREQEPPSIQLRNVSFTDANGISRLRDVTLSIYPHEIVGIAAVEGNGQHELLRISTGRLAPTSGTASTPRHVAFVPEDRHRDALVLDFPLFENSTLPTLRDTKGTMDWESWRETTRTLMTDYDVRGGSPNAEARTLSGGNQQKFVLAREVAVGSQALVVENPTRGLDIHASQAIRERLLAERDRGTAVVVYSSDLDEILALADRVLVLYNGTLIEGMQSRESIGNAMIGRT